MQNFMTWIFGLGAAVCFGRVGWLMYQMNEERRTNARNRYRC